VKHLPPARSFHVDEDLALSETPTASASIFAAGESGSVKVQ